MSDPGSQALNPTRADLIQAEAGSWIARRDSIDWGAEDQLELDSWLAQSTAHTIAFVRLEDMWKRADRLKALVPSSRREGGILREFTSGSFALKSVAAAIVLACLGTAASLYLSRPAEMVYTTAVGGHKLLKLADGSTVDLNTDTTLRLSKSGHRITATLDKGEVFFRIRHDPSRVFVVLAGGHRVTDLGTEFVVRSEPNHLEVTLIAGSASLDAPDGRMQTPILLTPGDDLTVANNLITTTKKSSHRLSEELGWRRGMLIFENTPLSQVVAEFNRYETRRIVVADRHTAAIPLSASFPTDGAESFLELAKAMLGIKVEQRDNEFVISR